MMTMVVVGVVQVCICVYYVWLCLINSIIISYVASSSLFKKGASIISCMNVCYRFPLESNIFRYFRLCRYSNLKIIINSGAFESRHEGMKNN